MFVILYYLLLGGLTPPASAFSLKQYSYGMKEYRRGSHSVFQLHIHMVWCTKYRKKVLEKDVGNRLRELSRQICSDMGVEILSGKVLTHHVPYLLLNN
jgi:putative transposase